MKKIIALLFFIVTSSAYAQNSGITYQAVIYNPSTEILPGNNNPNVVLAAKDICLRFSIMDTNSSLEYQEVQKVKTDEFGMVNLIVGDGDQVNGYAADFDAVIWNSTNKNLKVEIDASGNCTNFIEISNQKFSSVPFAYASKTAESISGIVPIVNGGTGSSTVSGAKSNLGLNNVDNTSDLNKPVSTATQTALDAKAPLASPGFTGIPTAPTAAAGTSSTQIATTAFVNAALATAASPDATTTLKGRIQLAGDLGGTADAPTVPGLSNKENLANKSTDIVADANSTIKYPSVKLIKEYVDSQLSAGAVDADSTTKGIIKLSGDLEGTADAPTIKNSAVIGKVLAGFTPTSGTVMATDNILQAIQKLDGNVGLKANIDSPTFTGTVSGIDKTMVGLGNVDNTSDADKPVSTVMQLALNAKEDAANKSTNIALGDSDDFFPTQKAVKTYVNNNSTPDASSTLKGKLQLAGDLAGSNDASSPVITNNAITTVKINNGAVTPEKINKGSNNSVLVTDATGTVAWLDQGAFGAKADDSTIEGVGTAASPFKVKLDGIDSDKIKNNAVTNLKLADNAVTNIKLGETISVAKGGTGATSLTGYLKGNGTAAFSSVSTIPVTDVTGAVRSVNGVLPDNTTGNVAVVIGRVFTGTAFNPNSAASVIAINSGPNPIKESDIYIVSGQSGTPNDNGRTFINDGTNWLEISTNVAALESTFVKLSGSTMAGNLDFPTGKKIIIADAPTVSTDAANKAYVDNLITSSATPDATTSIIGKIKLAGDLGGTAAVPTVPGLALKAPLASPSFTGTPLAPTAAAGTNTTQIATTAFVTAASGTPFLKATTTNDVLNDKNTNFYTNRSIGIGTNNPVFSLDVVGGFAMRSAAGAMGSGYGMEFLTNASAPRIDWVANGAYIGQFSSNNTDFLLKNSLNNSGNIRFFTSTAGSGQERLTILNNGNVGIGTNTPTTRLEIKQGTAGNSGLRLTNLTASSTATTASSKVLGVNNNGDVILTNIPGTQNIVTFSTATPTTSGVVFTPNLQTDQSVVYQSASNSSLWTYNGTDYVTYTPPATTAWNLAGTSNDAGGNKIAAIERTGSTSVTNGFIRATGSGNTFTIDPTEGGGPRLKLGPLATPNGYFELGAYNGMNNFDTKTRDFNIFSTARANALVLKHNTGNIGIGTNTPTASLDVISSVGATATVNADVPMLKLTRPTLNGKWGGVAQFSLGSYNTNAVAQTRLDIGLNDGGDLTTLNTIMTLQANGNTGLGITTPSQRLDVNGTGLFRRGNSTGSLSNQILFGHNGGSLFQHAIKTRHAGGTAQGNAIDFYVWTNAVTDATVATQHLMSLEGQGRVGIGGITNPTSVIDAASTSVATNTVNASRKMLRLSIPTAEGTKPGNVAEFNMGSYATGGSASTRLDLALNNGGDNTVSQVMTWQANGNVGINNTSPSAPLVVQGVSGNGSLKLIAPSVASGDNWWMGFGHGTTSTDANDRARFGVDIANGGSGRLFFTTGAPGAQTRAMFIDEGQRVGIGTSTPNAQLGVVSGTTDVARFTTSLSTTNYAGIGIGNASGAWGKIAAGEGKFQIRNFSTDATIINAELGTGNVGIGTTSPISRLEVNGSATNTAAFNNGAANAIAFSLSNLAYTSLSAQLFNLTGMKDGGTYTLAVQGTTSGTSSFMGVNPSGTPFVFKSINNGTTIAGKDTLYTFVVMGTTVYVYMATGF